jgi:type I restriction enzyme S subunit
MPTISKGRLETALIEVPPLALQQKFAARIAAAEYTKMTYRRSLRAHDALFSSLQHRAFRGQL